MNRANVDSGAGVTKHTGGMVVSMLKLCSPVFTAILLLWYIKGTSRSSRQNKETADIKHPRECFVYRGKDKNLFNSLEI